ncbi:MAG: helix-turn-helix domain-containing protein [Bacilli bacterium]
MVKGISNEEEFKKTIVRLLETGKKASYNSSEYNLNVKNIYNWQKKYENDNSQ